MLLGPSGVGKTHIALSLAYRAVEAGHKVRFLSAANMMQLSIAKSQGRLKEYFNRAILGPKLLIIYESLIKALPSRLRERCHTITIEGPCIRPQTGRSNPSSIPLRSISRARISLHAITGQIPKRDRSTSNQ